MRQQVQDDFGVAVGLENVAPALQILSDRASIDQIPIMRERHLPPVTAHFQRLGVFQVGVAGGGVTRVGDGEPPWQALDHIFREYLIHMSHAFFADEVVAVGYRYPCALLSTMLQGV